MSLPEKELNAVLACPLFKNVTRSFLQDFFSRQHISSSTAEKGKIIAFRGDIYEELKIVLSGEISAEIQSVEGKTVKIETLKTPNAVASAILFAEDNALPVTLIAQTNTKLISIPKKSVLQLCQKNGQFLSNILQDNGNKVTILAEKLRMLQFKTIRQKVAGYLLDLCGKQNSSDEADITIRLPYTKEGLAEIFGVTRPSLSRVFSDLATSGIIEVNGRSVTISDSEELKLILEED